MSKQFLHVPYAKKDIAKKNGARWDHVEKKWFVDGDVPEALLIFVSKKMNGAEGQLWEECARCGNEPVYMPRMLCEDCW